MNKKITSSFIFFDLNNKGWGAFLEKKWNVDLDIITKEINY